jgi:hypothetical protein
MEHLQVGAETTTRRESPGERSGVLEEEHGPADV